MYALVYSAVLLSVQNAQIYKLVYGLEHARVLTRVALELKFHIRYMAMF